MKFCEKIRPSQKRLGKYTLVAGLSASCSVIALVNIIDKRWVFVEIFVHKVSLGTKGNGVEQLCQDFEGI